MLSNEKRIEFHFFSFCIRRAYRQAYKIQRNRRSILILPRNVRCYAEPNTHPLCVYVCERVCELVEKSEQEGKSSDFIGQNVSM